MVKYLVSIIQPIIFLILAGVPSLLNLHKDNIQFLMSLFKISEVRHLKKRLNVLVIRSKL